VTRYGHARIGRCGKVWLSSRWQSTAGNATLGDHRIGRNGVSRPAEAGPVWMERQRPQVAAGTLLLMPNGSIMGLYGAPFTPERINGQLCFQRRPDRNRTEAGH
jgi:hypothetical protein